MLKHLTLLKIQNMMDIEESIFIGLKFFLIKRPLLVVVLKMKMCQTKELAEEMHKPIISKLEKRKVHSAFIDKI